MEMEMNNEKARRNITCIGTEKTIQIAVAGNSRIKRWYKSGM